MLPVILYPLGLLGLLAVPALVAIYLFRNRFKRQTVSSLMLWLDPREARAGGTRLRRLQVPLLLALEVLALVLLALAASEPLLRLSTASRPLVVVLDDSYSMLGGGEDSSRQRAVVALREELARRKPYSIRFILAGERPQTLGEPVRSVNQAMELLDGWRCRAPMARLDDAVALGAELGGELALVLVLTDHKPSTEIPEKSRLRWVALGRPLPGVAFVNAARTLRDGLDRSLMEVANLSDEPREVRIVVEPLDGGAVLRRTSMSLPAGETQRVILQLPGGTPAVRARIEGTQSLDGEITLLPDQDRNVKVDTRLRDRRLRDPIQRAVRSSRLATLEEDSPHLIFSDRASEPDAGNAWVVYLISEKEATAFTGPFVLDRSSPLTDGLGLKTVIWGAGDSTQIDGAPVIMAGNVPLMTDSEVQVGSGATRHDIRIRLRPELSTLIESTDWPILIWNLLSYRAAALPGLPRSNIRLGEQITCELGAVRDRVRLREPNQPAHELSVKDRSLTLRGDDVGVYTVMAGEAKFQFAVNALNRDESDLRQCATGTWGDWLDDTTLRLDYTGVSWLLLLIVLGIATIHLLVMAQGRSAST